MADRKNALYWGTIYTKKQHPECCPLIFIEDSATVTHTGLGTQGDPFIFTAAGGGASAARNGASVESGFVTLGQEQSAVGDPAALLSSREIPMGGNPVNWYGGATVLSANQTLVGNGNLLQIYDDVVGSGTQSQVYIAPNWNTTGAPTIMVINALETAVDIGAKYLDFQNNGGTVFSVDRFGIIQQTDLFGSTNANSFGFDIVGSGNVIFQGDGAYIVRQKMKVGALTNVSPTATLELAGSPTGLAGTAALKINSGTVLATPENGAVEFDGTHFYGTAGGVRIQLDNDVAFTTASNGLYGSGTSVIFGQPTGALGNPAQLIIETEVPLNGNNLLFTGTGHIGIATLVPTARLHIGAGSATAGTAPLKLTSGTLLTTAEAGAIEFLTDKYYGTITTGAARKEIALLESSITGGRITFANSSGRIADNANLQWNNGGTVFGIGIGGIVAAARLHIAGGTATASTAPIKLTSGTNLTTAETGAIEYNGTNLFFTRTGTTRESVLTGNSGAAAPATTAGVTITNFYGSSATNFLGDPNSWASVVIGGTTYKIPLYT